MIFIFYLTKMVNCIAWFSNVKTNLNFWNKAHFGMSGYLFNIVLDLIFYHLIKDFAFMVREITHLNDS